MSKGHLIHKLNLLIFVWILLAEFSAIAGPLEILQKDFKTADSNESLLRQLAAAYPDQTELVEIGHSAHGHPLIAINVSDQTHLSPKPSLFFNCAHHAVERLSVEYCYQILVDLLKPENRSWLSKYRFWVLPVVNPDGLIEGHFTRKNGNGVDLNRNYPFKWGAVPEGSSGDPKSDYYRGKSPGSEPETHAIMNLANREKFVLSISFHTSATKVLVPYTIPGAKDPTPDLGWDFANLIEQNSITHKNEQSGEFQKSGAGMKTYKPVKRLYAVDGTDQDWHYWANGTLALLVEGPFSNSKIANYENSKTVTQDFMPGFWKVMEYLEGLPKLLIQTTNKGFPAAASVMIKEFQYFEGEAFTSSPVSGLYTFLFPEPGRYTAVADSKEYPIQISSGITVMKVSTTSPLAYLDFGLFRLW